VSAPVEALHAGFAHQPGDPFVVDRHPEAEGELGVDPRPAVGSAGLFMDLADLFDQQGVLLLPRRRGPTEPVVVARAGYPENSTGHRDINTGIGVVGEFADQSKR
jgi:hypothetical protein